MFLSFVRENNLSLANSVCAIIPLAYGYIYFRSNCICPVLFLCGLLLSETNTFVPVKAEANKVKTLYLSIKDKTEYGRCCLSKAINFLNVSSSDIFFLKETVLSKLR